MSKQWEREIGPGEGWSGPERIRLAILNVNAVAIMVVGYKWEDKPKDQSAYLTVTRQQHGDGYRLALTVIDNYGTQGLLADWLDENRPEANYLANLLRRVM